MASMTRLAGIATLCLLSGWAFWESRWQPVDEPVTATSAAAPTEEPSVAIEPPALGTYAVTLERPLFYDGRVMPGRQTEDGDTPTAPTAPLSNAGLSLTAIIIEGEERSALLAPAGSAVSTRLRVGDNLSGWKLLAIDDDAVTVEGNGRQQRLSLRRYSASHATSTNKGEPPRLTKQQSPRTEIER